MKVVEFKNLRREEGQIFYIRRYYCVTVLDLPTGISEHPTRFSIEMNGLGNKTIDISIENQVNYPLVPVKKAITEYILTEDREGRLPC